MARIRVAVLFMDYQPGHDVKDQGMYLRALSMAGYRPILITEGKSELRSYQPRDYDMVTTTRQDFASGNAWTAVPIDIVIAVDLVVASRSLFTGSFFEGSPLTIAEALCSGATVVGTPIPATHHFIEKSQFGRVSRGFHHRSLLEALVKEAQAWDTTTRHPYYISRYWQAKQHPETIAQHLDGLVKHCLQYP